MTLQVTTAAANVARTAHYVIPTGQTQPIPTLLLEPQRTNLCIRSEEFDTWPTQSGGSVTANAIAAPDGAVTADLITGGGVNESGVYRAITFTGDGEKCCAIYLKAGTSPSTDLLLFDITASAVRHRVRVTWTNGVPTIATQNGTGTLYPVEALGNGWYRILFSATGIVAANGNRFYLYPHNLTPFTGTVYAWGAQAENAVVPSSYIKTEGSTVTRSADSLYFPASGALTERTVYARFIERGTIVSTFSGLCGYFNGTSAPNFRLERGSSGTYRASHNNASVDVHGAGTGTPTPGQVVEVRGVLRSGGEVLAGISIDGGTEGVGSTSSTNAISATAVTRFYIGGPSLSSPIAATHVCVAAGEQSRDTMRQLAGVV